MINLHALNYLSLTDNLTDSLNAQTLSLQVYAVFKLNLQTFLHKMEENIENSYVKNENNRTSYLPQEENVTIGENVPGVV